MSNDPVSRRRERPLDATPSRSLASRVWWIVPLAVVLLGAGWAITQAGLGGAAPVHENAGSDLAPANPPGGIPTAGDVGCESKEEVTFHVHAHLAVYNNGVTQRVPSGIGIGQPWQVVQTDSGPFVGGGSTFCWLHTHTQDGVIHIESPDARGFTLGQFFEVWGQPLSPNQVGPLTGQVFAYLDGAPIDGDPSAIPLGPHAVIQLNVGTDAPPPQPFTFPAGL